MFVRKRYWLFFGLVAFFVVGTFYAIVLRETGSGSWLVWLDSIIADDKRISVWANIITPLTAVGAAIYAVVQYLSICRSQRQEKAAEIMRMYATRLMYPVGVISRIFEDYEHISAIANKIDRNEPLRFTRDELAKYPVTAKDIKVFNSFLSDHQIKTMEQKAAKDNKYEEGQEKPLYIHFLPDDAAKNLPQDCTLAAYIAVTLNELEYLSMEIESGAADDNYLYGSLHQSFLPFVHSSAMLIQKMNIRASDDENFYPYLSRLYRRWVTKENENHKLVGKAFTTSENRHRRREKLL